MKHSKTFYIVNGITIYRLSAAPVLFGMVLMHEVELFKWFLLLSFSTDAIDGFLARRWKVTSATGARLDSIADDLTVMVATVALFISQTKFVFANASWFIVPLILFVVQMIIAFAKYGKITSFHTYAAKVAALAQGLFLLSAFFFEQPNYYLMIAAAVVTTYDLVEEIILALLIKEWITDVKGIWWIFRKKS